MEPSASLRISLRREDIHARMDLNATQSKTGKGFRRNYLACRNCRLRKVRCDLGDPSQPTEVCARCRRERRPCIFETKKRRSVDPSFGSIDHNQKRMSLGADPNVSNASQNLDKDGSPKHFSTMNGALLFLANAAGRMAADDIKETSFNSTHIHHRGNSESSLSLTPVDTPRNDDRIPLTMLSLVPPYLNTAGDVHSSQRARSRGGQASLVYASSSNKKTFSSRSSNQFLGSDTLNHIGNVTGNSQSASSIAGDVPLNQSNLGTDLADSRAPYTRVSTQNDSYHAADAPYNISAIKNNFETGHTSNKPSSLEEIEYIGNFGILSAAESEFYIRMFFTTLHPFFPHIPQFLHLPKVLSGYPLLLCTILTISTRYHSMEGIPNANRQKSLEIHERLWLHVQGMISRTVWAEASTRSIGTVFAFLLLTEWNPRAIHWRVSDYANKAEDMSDNRDTEVMAGDFPMNAGPEPAGLGAMRRSYRMGWMLIGSAVRLAQDMAFMEVSSSTFVATHIAEINSVMNMKRRSMLSHSLAEIDLMSTDITEEEMETREEQEYNVTNANEKGAGSGLDYTPLIFTESQRAQIELLQIISLGHESLYGYKAQLGCLTQRQNLAILNIMNPMIKNWGAKYRHYLVPTKSKTSSQISFDQIKEHNPSIARKLHTLISNESFIFDFNYTKLYIFSLALSPSPNSNSAAKEGKIALKLDEISKSAQYIEQAFNAANEILQVAHRVHKLKMLKFMPVRWVTKVVRAVAFIVKCYLTITAHKSTEAVDGAPSSLEDFDSTVLSLSLISVDQIVKSIYDVAITLRDCSPDELHLCTSYSKILLYLYSEMKGARQKMSSDINDSSAAPEMTPFVRELSPNLSQARTSNEPSSSKEIPDFGFVPDNDLMDWFINNRDIGGLDFVGPWTELIEQQLEKGVAFEL